MEGADPGRDDDDRGKGQPLLVDPEGHRLQDEAADHDAEAREEEEATPQELHNLFQVFNLVCFGFWGDLVTASEVGALLWCSWMRMRSLSLSLFLADRDSNIQQMIGLADTTS